MLDQPNKLSMKSFACVVSLALFTFALLTGCESPGRALDESAVAQIRDGQTTKAEIDTIFGEPTQMTKSPAGHTLYYYERFYGPDRQSAFSFDPRRNESDLLSLSVLFNPAGIVVKHFRSHTQPEIDRRMRNAGSKLNAGELNRILPRKTTRAELAAWFGAPWSEQLTLSGQHLVAWLYADANNVAGRVDMQALEVIIDDAGVVQDFRVTKRDVRH
jgi:outer membrane protein assembly factor BamE (lipoprotein component of BamABCDE complex)